MHRNGPKAKRVFRSAFFAASSQRAEAAPEQDAEKGGDDRQSRAKEKARAGHQLDVAATEAARDNEREEQHGRLTITQPSSRDFIPGPGKTNWRRRAADQQQRRETVIDLERVDVHERHDR